MFIKANSVQKISVYCPRCGRKVMRNIPKGIDQRFDVRCKHCEDIVVYDSAIDKAYMDNKREKITSTGKRFY